MMAHCQTKTRTVDHHADEMPGSVCTKLLHLIAGHLVQASKPSIQWKYSVAYLMTRITDHINRPGRGISITNIWDAEWNICHKLVISFSVSFTRTKLMKPFRVMTRDSWLNNSTCSTRGKKSSSRILYFNSMTLNLSFIGNAAIDPIVQ